MLVRLRWTSTAPFVCPVDPVPRTAVLIPGFRSTSAVRVFAEGWGARAKKFAPESIAATLEQWNALASEGVVLTHSMIVFSRPGDPRLSAEDRDRFWRTFEVPLFEQVIGDTGRLLAFECEAHQGLHVVSPRFNPPGELDPSVCGCGLESPRLVTMVTRPRKLAAAAAGFSL